MTSLKSTLFNKAAQATQEIHSHFDREFEDGTLATWNLNGSDDDEGPELIALNHYFTPVLDAGGTKNMPFGQGVDPHGVLAHMRHSGSGSNIFVHMEDNQVGYYNSHVELHSK